MLNRPLDILLWSPGKRGPARLNKNRRRTIPDTHLVPSAQALQLGFPMLITVLSFCGT